MSESGVIILGPNGQPIQASLENPSLSLNDPEAWRDVFDTGPTHAGVSVTPKSALGYPPLWRALNIISGDVGRMPLNIYRRLPNGGREKAIEHPSHRLLRRRASAVMRASALKRTLTWHAMFYGNGTAAIFRDPMGRPTDLLVLDPSITCLGGDDDGLFVLTTINNQSVVIPYEDVFHIKGLSNNGIWGMSVHDIMREALGLPIAAREYTARFFGSGSNMSGIIMVPTSLNPEAVKNTLKTANELHAGLKNSHKIALFKDNVKFIPTTVTPHDSETTGILEHEIRTVSAITGVPPHKLGDVTRTSYNSLEQEEQAYLNDALAPWMHEWEEEADTKLLSEQEQRRDDLFHEFLVDARLRMDSAARWNSYKVGRETGVLSANDILMKENMQTIGTEGDIRFRPSNWVPLGETPEKGVQAAHFRMISDLLAKKAQIEESKIEKALSRTEDLRAWLESFYGDHEIHVLEALEPVRPVIEAELGFSLKKRWNQSISQFFEQRKQRLLEKKAIPSSYSALVKTLLTPEEPENGEP